MKLSNEQIDQLLQDASNQQAYLEEAMYELYKSAYTITQTNNFRGDGADAHKHFIEQSTIHHINIFLNIFSEVRECIENIQTAFMNFEQESSGKVSSASIDDSLTKTRTQNINSGRLIDELRSLESRASEFISIRNTNAGNIRQEGTAVANELRTIQNDFEQADSQASDHVQSLSARVNDLAASIQNIQSHYFTSSGSYDIEKTGNLTNQSWYQTESATVLTRKLDEDPFFYSADSVAVWEDQFARGISEDVYIAGTGSVASASYTSQLDDGSYSLEAEASLLQGGVQGQLTDHLTGEANAQVLYGNTEVQAGWDEGFKASGSVGVASGDAKMELADGLVKAEAKADFLSANGQVAFHVEDKDNYTIGFSGNASVASAKAGISTSLLSVPSKNEDGKEVDLFAFSGSAKAKGGGSIKAMISSENVYELDSININATTFELGGALGLGVEFSITIPTVSFNFW